MKERLPLDDIIRQRLEDYESEVPDNMFDRISQIRGEERTNNPDEIIKEKLANYESAVPVFLFDNIMDERAARTPSSEEVIRRKLIEPIKAPRKWLPLRSSLIILAFFHDASRPNV